MKNARQDENERQWKKKVNENTYNISSIKRVTKGLFMKRNFQCSLKYSTLQIITTRDQNGLFGTQPI